MDFKSVRHMMWLKSGTGERGRITWKPAERFFRDHPYVDYSGNTGGKPRFYTKVGSRFFFNCQVDETITIRIWYQGLHGNFSNDAISHSFDSDNLAFQAIVACVLAQIPEAITGIELSPKATAAAAKKEFWINRLIEADIMKADEEIQMGENVDRETSEGETQPYGWV